MTCFQALWVVEECTCACIRSNYKSEHEIRPTDHGFTVQFHTTGVQCGCMQRSCMQGGLYAGRLHARLHAQGGCMKGGQSGSNMPYHLILNDQRWDPHWDPQLP